MASRNGSDHETGEPYNLEAEQTVLGSCLIDREVIISVAGRLNADDFWRLPHAYIYRAIVTLWERRQPADLILVADELRRMPTLIQGMTALELCGGESYLADLIAATPTAVHANYYADLVRSDSERRRFISAAQEIAQAGYSDALPLDALREQAAAAVRDAPRGVMRRAKTARDLAGEWFARDEDALEVARLKVGITSLDQITGGFQAGQLIIVAARPAIGKTAIALQMTHNLAKAGRDVMFYSLEMRDADLQDRLLGVHAGINMHDYSGQRGYREQQRQAAMEATARLAEMPYRILEHYGGQIEPLIAGIREEHTQQHCDAIVVDYLQLIKGSGRSQNRNNELADITRALKTLALELGIPVIALSQLSRAVDSRSGENAYPKLSDLRDSGAIEQDADVVLFLHRENDDATDTWFSVSKHRQGPTGTFHLYFAKHRTTFFEQARLV